MMTTETPVETNFSDFELSKPVMRALKDAGYEQPTPIQAQTIPVMASGKDLVGQAQTGTGKTAAFALPILSQLDMKIPSPQVLVLAPTRELAIQVAEAFQGYGAHIRNLHVLPVYGGQEYGGQIRALKRGVHIVVGTPGRVMDHMRRGTLKLGALTTLVLDEADEMLRMGFIDDVEWILEQTPDNRQIALFSATMPTQIRKIAKKHLNDPAEITIKMRTTTAENIRQRYWMVSAAHKMDALTRILEAESFDGVLIFVRTKLGTMELAERLKARGYSAAPINGDLNQAQRERTINQFKKGKLDILIGTDVAARGLDVDRISHVINYDVPFDTETYIHRVGRTGRAGRSGEAILFASPREKRMLGAIERATRQKIELFEMPTTEAINDIRIGQFKQRITDTLAAEDQDLKFFGQLVEQYRDEHDIPALEVAAALAKLYQGDTPLLLQKAPKAKPVKERAGRDRSERGERGAKPYRGDKAGGDGGSPEEGMDRYRVAVGRRHRVKPGNIVGAIANEAGLDGEHIGAISIFEDYSTVDLPEGMPNDIFQILKKAYVAGEQLNLSRMGEKKSAMGGAKRSSKHVVKRSVSNSEKPTKKKKFKKDGKKKFKKKKKADK
jgi:ATP-dependent RNA helicase DeaD